MDAAVFWTAILATFISFMDWLTMQTVFWGFLGAMVACLLVAVAAFLIEWICRKTGWAQR